MYKIGVSREDRMTTELKKYLGKKLSTDEYAEAMNARDMLISELEQLRFETGEDNILLKFGTLKGWQFTSKKGQDLMKEYASLGMSMGTLSQKDTQEQKELICKMIDECNGSIQSDWSGKYLTKKEAKEMIKDTNE